MENICITGETVLSSKNIAILHKNKVSEAHMGRMVHMCFSNMDFADRILKCYLGLEEYDELFGDMIFFNIVNQKGMEEIRTYFVSESRSAIQKYIENRERKLQKNIINNVKAAERISQNRFVECVWKNTFFLLGNMLGWFSQKTNILENAIAASIYKQTDLLKGNTAISGYEKISLQLEESVNAEKKTIVQKKLLLFAYAMNQMRTRRERKAFLSLTSANMMLRQFAVRMLVWKHAIGALSGWNARLQKKILQVLPEKNTSYMNRYVNFLKKIELERAKRDSVFLLERNLKYIEEGAIFRPEGLFLFAKEGKTSVVERYSILLNKYLINQSNLIEHRVHQNIAKELIDLKSFFKNNLSQWALRNLLTTYAISQMQVYREWKTFLNLADTNRMSHEFANRVLICKRAASFLDVRMGKAILQFLPEKNIRHENSYISYLEKIGFGGLKRDRIFLSEKRRKYIEERTFSKAEELFLFAKEGGASVAENHFILLKKHGINQLNSIDNRFPENIIKEIKAWKSFFENKLYKDASGNLFFFINSIIRRFSEEINTFSNNIEKSMIDRQQSDVLKGDMVVWKYKKGFLQPGSIINAKKGTVVQKKLFYSLYTMNQRQDYRKQKELLRLANAAISRMPRQFAVKRGMWKCAVDILSSMDAMSGGNIQQILMEKNSWYENIYIDYLKKVELERGEGWTGFFNIWNTMAGKNITRILPERDNRYENAYINYLGKIELGKAERQPSGERVYFIKRSSGNEEIIKIQEQMQDIVKGLKLDLAEEMHKSIVGQRAVRLLEEEVERQQEQIRELEFMHKKTQESFRDMKEIQNDKDSYLLVFGNEIKLERMRYGIPS